MGEAVATEETGDSERVDGRDIEEDEEKRVTVAVASLSWESWRVWTGVVGREERCRPGWEAQL